MEAACGMAAGARNGAAVRDAGVRPAVSTAPPEATILTTNLRIRHGPPSRAVSSEFDRLSNCSTSPGPLDTVPRIGASFASQPIVRVIQYRTQNEADGAIGTKN